VRRGNLIDAGDAGRPPCRSDHRYEFVVNKSYPPAWDLYGKAKAYITLRESPGVTANGSFTLRITGVGSRDVACDASKAAR
jgi:hypothetical protein